MASAFGMPSEALEIEGVEALSDDPVESPEPEAPEGEQPEPEQEAPAPEAAEAEVPEGEEPPASEPEGYEFAGRFYTSQEEAERSYREMQGLQSRTVEQQRADQQRFEAERAQMAAFLQQIEPVLRQAQEQQAQPPQPAVRVPGPGDSDFDGENPEHVQRYLSAQIENQVAARTAQMQQQMAQAFDQRLQQVVSPMQQAQLAQAQVAAQSAIQQTAEAYQTDIDSFRSSHPEVAQGSSQEAALAGVLQPLGRIGVMPSAPMLQMGLDATRSPALYREVEAERVRVEGVAMANPQIQPTQIPSLFDNDQGIATMYHRAGLAPQGTQSGSPRTARPHVETGGNGAPVETAPGQTPDDLDRAFEKYQSDQKTASPLFGGGVRVS